VLVLLLVGFIVFGLLLPGGQVPERCKVRPLPDRVEPAGFNPLHDRDHFERQRFLDEWEKMERRNRNPLEWSPERPS